MGKQTLVLLRLPVVLVLAVVGTACAEGDPTGLADAESVEARAGDTGDLSADSPEEVRRTIAEGRALLARVRELAGRGADDEVVDLLRRSGAYLSDAVAAFRAGDYREAGALAEGSIALTRAALDLLGDQDLDDALEERAKTAIEQARAYYKRASDLAGSEPPAEVVRLLRRARSYLDDAVSAFEAEGFRRAIEYARTSAAASRRAIAILTGTGSSR